MPVLFSCRHACAEQCLQRGQGLFSRLWREKLEAPLHSVTVAHSRLIKPAEIKAIDGIVQVH
jgi:uncharacterized protein Usg